MKTVIAYILAIAAAEAVGAYADALLGAIIHAGLIAVLLAHYGLRPTTPSARVLPALVVAPLLRLLSLTLAVPGWPNVVWHALAGGASLWAAVVAARRLGLRRAMLGLRLRYWALQALIAMSGLFFGLAAFAVLRPSPALEGFDWPALLLSAAVLAVFTAVVEEFIFRGLVQGAAQQAFGGPAAVLASSLLFASMYLGSLSPAFFAVISLVGFYFGYCAQKTGSLAGVTLAHVLMNLGLMFVWPAVAVRIGLV